MNGRPNDKMERLFFVGGVDPRSLLRDREAIRDGNHLYTRFHLGETQVEISFGEDGDGVFCEYGVVAGEDIEDDGSLLNLVNLGTTIDEIESRLKL